MISRRLVLGAALSAPFTAPAHIRADTWPSKPIRVVLPGPGGGVIDIGCRAVSEAMLRELGQPLVIDPRPGANGIVAAQTVLGAPADGYTLYLTVSGHVVLDLLMKAPFDVMGDFKPIAMLGVSSSLLCVPPSLPATSVAEFVTYAKANPGKLNYLNPGNGSSIHLSAELLKYQYKFDMTSVPYRGIPPGLPDLLEGRLQVGLLPGPLALQHVQSGKLRALAVLASQRLPTLPDVPTFAEAGFADAQVMSWYTIAVRAGTPGAIVERLHGSAMKALQNAETRDRLTKAGCEVPAPRSPADVLAMWKADYARYGKLVKDAGIKGES